MLDIFAPGTNVLSTWYTSDTATNTISGTSMATPHISGLICYIRTLYGTASAADATNKLISLATTGVVKNAGSGSPNRLAYNGSGA